jgi:hypothetical protein
MSNFDYRTWWQNWYTGGGTSGPGSYGILAEFKAEIVNQFIKEHNINSVIEFGCGDGNQLSYMNYRQYLGLDVTRAALDRCMARFRDDQSKSFMFYDPQYFVNKGSLNADLVVCFDVLYHITDENDLVKTLADIFSCTQKYVILYTITKEVDIPVPEIKYRDLNLFLRAHHEFIVHQFIPQRYQDQSYADFLILAHKNI